MWIATRRYTSNGQSRVLAKTGAADGLATSTITRSPVAQMEKPQKEKPIRVAQQTPKRRPTRLRTSGKLRLIPHTTECKTGQGGGGGGGAKKTAGGGGRVEVKKRSRQDAGRKAEDKDRRRV